jgi:hypothetical protein
MISICPSLPLPLPLPSPSPSPFSSFSPAMPPASPALRWLPCCRSFSQGYMQHATIKSPTPDPTQPNAAGVPGNFDDLTSPHLMRYSVLDSFLHGTGLDIFLRKTPKKPASHATHSLPHCCWLLGLGTCCLTLNSEL